MFSLRKPYYARGETSGLKMSICTKYSRDCWSKLVRYKELQKRLSVFRMAMLAAFVRLCVLFILLVMYVHTWSFFVLKLSKEQRGGFEWYHFATMWNFYLQTVYTVIAFFTGVIDLVARKEVILTKRSLQKLTTNLISPLTSFIVIAFWVLFLSNVSSFEELFRGRELPALS